MSYNDTKLFELLHNIQVDMMKLQIDEHEQSTFKRQLEVVYEISSLIDIGKENNEHRIPTFFASFLQSSLHKRMIDDI